MIRSFVLLTAFVGGSLFGWAPAPEQPPACCKTCRKGTACGDTCIARDRDCTEPKGCACDAEER
ncbi:MAG: hypothetical protein R6X02_27395 [Enhygromyxa sp.]